ncbi:hypothetical protein PR202_gb02814 [Eleusine coracana subsp. coracana]|uniref:Pentatricopeptide repeat-containing protein n=1 Tax=Eleusine coracana subsp. coracana TaxID=191504 RepID=A0AAV5DXS7_ELECO|nr:hypothetical protein PR202_gb02814 [Eleusine coracana subsp. coracana]
MALQAQQLPSFPFAFPALRILRLRCTLPSSTKFFLRSHPQLRTPRRRNHRAAYSPHRFLDHQAREGSGDRDERWDPPASVSRARLQGARRDKEEGGWWGPSHGVEAGPEERLQEPEDEAGNDVGEWDPPVSPFRGQREEPYHQGEEDEDGGGPECLDPSFFLQSQKWVSGTRTTTTSAMEEILSIARSPLADGPEFAKFLDGYNLEDLSEGDCVELMMRMVEEELVLGCVHLFQWMKEQERLSVPPRALLVAIAALGRTGMVDEIMEIALNLPLQREFHETVLYNAAMSAVTYCRRYDDAWEIFELMEKNNVQPDHMTSSILLNARDVIYEFGKIGLKPTVMTFNILMNAKSVKLFSNFYAADNIVASPLALERVYDWFDASSISKADDYRFDYFCNKGVPQQLSHPHFAHGADYVLTNGRNYKDSNEKKVVFRHTLGGDGKSRCQDVRISEGKRGTAVASLEREIDTIFAYVETM